MAKRNIAKVLLGLIEPDEGTGTTPLSAAMKGDVAGHSFHGNQYREGAGSESANDESTLSKFQDLADDYASRKVPNADLAAISDIAEAEVFREVASEWQMSFAGCSRTQDTVDDLLNGRNPSSRTEKAPQSAFAAIQLVDYMTNADSPRHYEGTDSLYRGLSDQDGTIAASMNVGDTLKWGIASFASDNDLAGQFLDNGKGVMLETVGRVVGGNLGQEQVLGGDFNIVAKNVDSDGVTHVTIQQAANIEASR